MSLGAISLVPGRGCVPKTRFRIWVQDRIQLLPLAEPESSYPKPWIYEGVPSCGQCLHKGETGNEYTQVLLASFLRRANQGSFASLSPKGCECQQRHRPLLCSLEYASVSQAAAMVASLGKGALIAKTGPKVSLKDGTSPPQQPAHPHHQLESHHFP